MASSLRHEPRAIIIGCGVGGIALAVNLKKKLKYHNFIIYDRERSIGGTWYLNTYPGVGCDVDSHLYSYSFNPNPNWSRRFADQPEILQYLQDTVDKFQVRPHVRLGVEVISAHWIDGEMARGPAWRVTLRDMSTNRVFSREAEILVSCVGGISVPQECNIPGQEKYQGEIWHSARWNHDFDLTGKTVAVVGNGCSAAQLVPAIAEAAGKVIQFQRSPQWINERPNSTFSALQKWCFSWIPGFNKLYRFMLWKQTDALHFLYLSSSKAAKLARAKATQDTMSYMKRMAPEKYHKVLIPEFPLGCKRRIFDPGYLKALHRDNVELTTESIAEFTESGLRTNKRDICFDAVVLSTGFKIQEFLTPIEVVGRSGISLNQHWRDTNGAQAYKGTFVTGFPNFGIVFGPNAFPAHNSVIFTNETQVEYLVKAVFKPIIRGDFDVIDVKESSEMTDAQHTQQELKSMVWNGGCRNWNLNESGRNTTNYFDYTWKFWMRLYWPKWQDFDIDNDRGTRPMHPAVALIFNTALVSLTVGGLALIINREIGLKKFLASVMTWIR